MRFRLEQRFTLPLPVVEDAFVDPELFAHLAGNDDLGRPQLLGRTEEDGAVRLSVRYAFTGQLSPPLSAMVDPAKVTWVEESVHDRRSHRTEFQIVPDHLGGRLACSGVVQLQAADGGATERVCEGDLKVSIPLVGSKVERTIVEGLTKQAAAQAEAVEAWLLSRR